MRYVIGSYSLYAYGGSRTVSHWTPCDERTTERPDEDHLLPGLLVTHWVPWPL